VTTLNSVSKLMYKVVLKKSVQTLFKYNAN
jgi:hypothetical protein